jgi:hypothetical protein
MSFPSRIAVIGLFKEAVGNDVRRFQNLSSLLGIDLDKGPKRGSEVTEKDASFEIDARAAGKVKEEIRRWFIDVMGDYLPIGYFDKGKRDGIESRERIYQYLPDDLYNKMGEWLKKKIGAKAKLQGYKELSQEDLILSDEVIDSKLIDMLGYYQDNKAELSSVINRTISPKKRETTDKKFEPGIGEMWFTPMVSEALYKNYVDYLKDRAKQEGATNVPKPEDLGVHLDKPDPHIIKILDSLKKFNIEIHDQDISQDTREKAPTVSIKFSIPELGKRNSKLYGDVLFSKKLPASMGSLRANKLHPVSVQYSGTGDKGLGIRFDEKQKMWEDNTAEAFKRVGFVDREMYTNFINGAVSNFMDKVFTKGKNLDEMISDLGGSIALRGMKDSDGRPVSISSAQDLEDVMGFGGMDLTKQELKSKRKTEQVKKRYKWQESMVKDKLEKVLEVWGPRIQEYLFKLTPEDGKAMREAIVRSDKFPSMEDFINKIKTGQDTKASFRSLFQTKEIADKALQLIFDEKTDPGEYAWKVLLTDYIKNKGLESELFSSAIRIMLYKDLLDSEGKTGEALRKGLQDSSWSTINKQYSGSDLKDFLNKQSNNISKGLVDLKGTIQEIIKGSKGQSAFKQFFDRLRSWDSVVGKDMERKIERILDGDDPSPIKIGEGLKAKMVSVREMDPRVEADVKKLESKKDTLEKSLKDKGEDPSKSEELKDLDLTINNLVEGKTVKKDMIDVSTPEGSKYLDELINTLLEERIQKAYVKQASYLDIIRLAKNFIQ